MWLSRRMLVNQETLGFIHSTANVREKGGLKKKELAASLWTQISSVFPKI